MTGPSGRPPSECAARIKLAQLLWGWRPHPTQRKWLLDDSDIKAAACGRRWGKTEAQAVDAATYAISFPGSEQIIVAPTYDQAKLIASGVERLLLSSNVTRNKTSIRKTPYPQISFGGSRVSARSSDDEGRSLRGHRADRVIVDEAAFVRESVITEVVQPMLADSSGQLILISTPYGRNYFWRMWLAGQNVNARVRSFRFPSTTNPHINMGYIRQQQADLAPRVFQAEYLAEFVDNASCVFPWTDIQACLELGEQGTAPWEPSVTAGIDWARYSDYTVCLAMDTARKPWRVTGADRFKGLSWEMGVRRVSRFLQDQQAHVVLCDATSVGDPALEQLRKTMLQLPDTHVDVTGLVFTAASKRELIDNLAIRLAHRDIALPARNIPFADTLKAELECYEYHLSPGGSITYSAPPGHHDDCVIALALAAWQAKKSPEFRIHTRLRPSNGEPW